MRLSVNPGVTFAVLMPDGRCMLDDIQREIVCFAKSILFFIAGEHMYAHKALSPTRQLSYKQYVVFATI